MRALAFGLVLACLYSPGLAAPAPISAVMLGPAGGQAGDVAVILPPGKMLSPGGAMVWQPPLRLRQPDGAICAVSDDVALITAPMFRAGRYLYVTTYSGSQSTLFAVALRDCRVHWHSPPFTGGPVRQGQRLRLRGAPDVVVGADGSPGAP